MRGNQVAEAEPLIMSVPDRKLNVNGMSSRRLVFEDVSHQETMLTYLNTMRKEGHFCDATLEVGGHNIPVHRAVLASCSVYMFELFSGKEEPSCKQHFKLKDCMDYASFEVLVNYAYTARLECDADLVKSVYKTASLLKMHNVAEQCSHFLTENLTPQTCLGIRAFASAYSDLDLTKKTDHYIEQHLQTLLERSPEFVRLPSIVVDIIGIESSGMNSSGEKQMCQLVVDWIELALDERPLERLTESQQVLYLANDNSLRDCLNDLDDSGLDNSDIVRDYKKLGKRKQLQPVKGIKDKGSNSGAGRLSKSPSLPLSSEPRVVDGQPSQTMGQYCIVASKMVGDKSFMCIAVLNDTLASISIKLRPQKCPEPDGKLLEPSSSPTREKKCPSPFESQCSLAPMSSARCGLGAAVLDGRLIALGGYDRIDCLNSVEAFDLSQNVWSPMKPMLTARGRFSVAQMGNQLYACGGCNGHAELSSVECYDSLTEQWTYMPELTIKRSSAGVTVCDDKLFVVGGWSGCNGHSACEMYDPKVGKWQAIAELNLGRSQTGVCTVDDEVVAVGGCDAWNSTNTVEIYDRVTNKWSYLPPMSIARRGVGVACFKGKLYVVGGSDGQSSLVSVEIYDPATGSWNFGPSLNTPRANMGIAVMNGRLFAVGGFSGKAFLESIEYLSEDAQEWCIYLPSGDKNGAGETRDASGYQTSDSEGRSSLSESEDVQNGKIVEVNGKALEENGYETIEENGYETIEENGIDCGGNVSQFKCIPLSEDENEAVCDVSAKGENGYREEISILHVIENYEIAELETSNYNGSHEDNIVDVDSHESSETELEGDGFM